MRRINFLLAAIILAMTPTARADFQEPDKLPAHADLPDPLVMMDGTRVTTKGQWFDKRRPELKALFQHYMYGEVPSFPVQVNAGTTHEDTKAFGGKATLREVMLNVDSCLPSIYLLYVVPNGAKGRCRCLSGRISAGITASSTIPRFTFPQLDVRQIPRRQNNKASEEGVANRSTSGRSNND